MNVKTSKNLLAASVAGLLAAAGTISFVQQAQGADTAPGTAAQKVPCYGINACKGKADCGGKGHACAGKNECKGKGSVTLPDKETCLQIEGGRLTVEPQAG